MELGLNNSSNLRWTVEQPTPRWWAALQMLNFVDIQTPGRMDITLDEPEDAVTCTHTIHIDQADTQTEGEAVRIGSVVVTSVR